MTFIISYYAQISPNKFEIRVQNVYANNAAHARELVAKYAPDFHSINDVLRLA